MINEYTIYIILGVFFAIFLGIILPFAIKDVKKMKDSQEEYEKNIDEYLNNDGEIIETRAEVVDMACGTKMSGTKNPKALQWYVIVFKDDLGKTIEVPVNYEMYEGFEVGMHGTLKLVDGGLYSFEAKD